MQRTVAIALICPMLIVTAAGGAAQTIDRQTAAERDTGLTTGGAWHFKSFRCVDTYVSYVGYRLVDSRTNVPIRTSGSVVSFATSLGFEGLHTPSGGAYFAGVTKYATDPVMAGERVGDRVQVCHVSTPVPSDRCDPDVDTRGREYRVYDYRRHAAYDGFNSEHTCGGA